jgi:hypothetical protein
VGRLVIVFCNVRKKIEDKDEVRLLLSSALVSLEEQKTITNVAFVVIFCRNLVRTTKSENECNICNSLLCKGIRMKKKQRKKKVNVHLLATDALVIF